MAVAPPPAAVPPAALAATPPKPTYHSERRWGLFSAGVSLFALGYAGDIALTYSIGHEPATTSLIPMVGPLVQLGQSWAIIQAPPGATPRTSAMIAYANSVAQTTATAVLAVDAVLQLAGMAMALAGPLSKARVRDRVAPASSSKLGMSLTPGAGGGGLTLTF
jgi:hypothetical protein